MASGYDVAGPEAAAAFAGLDPNYGGGEFDPLRGGQTPAAAEAAAAAREEARAREEAEVKRILDHFNLDIDRRALTNVHRPGASELERVFGLRNTFTDPEGLNPNTGVISVDPNLFNVNTATINDIIGTPPSPTNIYGDPTGQPYTGVGTPQARGTTGALTQDQINAISAKGDSAGRYGITPASQRGQDTTGGSPYSGAWEEDTRSNWGPDVVTYNTATPGEPLSADKGGGLGFLDSISEFFNPSYNEYGKHSSDYGITKGGDPGYRDFGAGDIITAIIGNPLLAAWQYSNRAAPRGRSQVNMDPANMGYGTKELYGVDVPDPNIGWEGGDDGNVEAIRRFLQTPTYGNIPQIDPASALAAYENAIRGIDAVVGERGFTGQGYAQAARDRSKTIFDELLPGQDVDTMLNEKIGRAFAEEALTAKEGEFRQQGIESINQAFPEGFSSEVFDPKAFSQAAENIYGQKLGGAQDIIARAGSRGQLSPRGGRLASESLLSQGPDVRSGISDIVSGVRSGLESGLEGIRGSALEQAQGYKLGDELFDVQPFTQQASDYLSERAPAIGTEISEAIGTDPLFDAVSALQQGGRQQGVVSGTPSFLDVLAEREGTPGTGRDRRGLGSRGSGVF